MKLLSYYQDLIGSGDVDLSLTLSSEQAAVVLKAHDYGVQSLTTGEIDLLHQVIFNLKDGIWP